MRRSHVRLRINLEAPKRCEPSVPKILFHRRCTLYMLGVDDHYPLKAVIRQKPSDFLSGSLEDGIVGVHPVQVMVEEAAWPCSWKPNRASAARRSRAFKLKLCRW